MAGDKITAKHQATLPLENSEASRLGPGGMVDIEPRMIDSGRVLVPRQAPDRSWVGLLKSQIQNQDHSMDSIRRSIATGIAKDGA